jgi:hypothetical protein
MYRQMGAMMADEGYLKPDAEPVKSDSAKA